MFVPTILPPQQQPPVSSSPAFLSRFPRSLSSLSLGGKRKSTERESFGSTTTANADQLLPQSAVHSHLSVASLKSKFTGSTKDLKHNDGHVAASGDHPPPLPQRNFMRTSQTMTFLENPNNEVQYRKSAQISDLDNSMNVPSPASSSPVTIGAANDQSSPASVKAKKRNKTKVKANSDPKISTHLFIQMEKGEVVNPNKKIVAETGLSVGNKPPPLPPRQPGMIEENPHTGNKYTGAVGKRPAPNSLDTLMYYPLVATCTAIKDNSFAAGDVPPPPNSNKPKHQHCSNSKATVSNSSSLQLVRNVLHIPFSVSLSLCLCLCFLSLYLSPTHKCTPLLALQCTQCKHILHMLSNV